MELARNAGLSKAYVDAIRATAPDAYVFCMGLSETYRAAVAAGQPVVREFYADRDYDRSGSIVFKRGIDALDPREVADKVLRACVEGRVRTVEGDDIPIEFESICFHSDSPNSLEMAEEMHRGLVREGVRIAPVSEFVAGRVQHGGTSSEVRSRSKRPCRVCSIAGPSPDKATFKNDGDPVTTGDVIGVIEVMKSFHEVVAPVSGRAIHFLVEDGDAIMAGEALAEVEA